MNTTEVLELVASLEGYLLELRETGLDGLPLGTVTPVNVSAATAVAAERSPATPSPQVIPEPLALPVDVLPPGGLASVREELGDCHRCRLGSTRTNLVFGVGNPAARLVFVGEAPGGDEDQQGIPFVGEAGQLLTKIITAMGFHRDEIYICNVLKCRPPQNRNPQADEIEQCHPFLLRQLQAIGPEVIVALGTFAAQTLLRTREPISKLRGVFHDYHGIQLMPTFHPAYLVRNQRNQKTYYELKSHVWDDMQKVMKRLGVEAPTKR
jgi:uracil-DNA glycosylase family 4